MIPVKIQYNNGTYTFFSNGTQRFTCSSAQNSFLTNSANCYHALMGNSTAEMIVNKFSIVPGIV